MNMKNNQWIFVSIYYARGSWTNLLCEISALKKSLEHTFSYFCVLFSQEKGENIRLAISVSTKEDYDNVIEKLRDRKSTRLNSSHVRISYAVFCLKKKKQKNKQKKTQKKTKKI